MKKAPKTFTLNLQASLRNATVAGTPMSNALAFKQDPGEHLTNLDKKPRPNRGLAI